MSPDLEGSFTVPMVIRNDENRYDGDLVSYFRAIFLHARNLVNPYHNFRHMFHVLCRCYEACIFYEINLSRREARNLLIAAMFHDFDHSGQLGNDNLNIERAIRGLRKHLAPEDQEFLSEIEKLIQATEYPYKIPSDELDLSSQILRDADLSQALSVAWIQQVVFGLAAEWGKTPLEALEAQSVFHEKLGFETEWAKKRFPKSMVDEKIEEARQILALLIGVA